MGSDRPSGKVDRYECRQSSLVVSEDRNSERRDYSWSCSAAPQTLRRVAVANAPST